MSAPRALIGDVGGTNTRLATSDDTRFTAVEQFDNATLGDLDAAIAAYLGAHDLDARALELRLAVAAPVSEGTVRLTNLDWSISCSALARRFGFRRVELANDFVAVARALPALGAEDSIAIGGGEAIAGAPCVVLGPGTGLGAGIWIPHGAHGLALATEAGHVTLAAADAGEAAVIAALRARYAHVSAERVLSGPGLVALYAALAELAGADDRQEDPAAVVARAADGADAIAVAALDHFFAFLGSVAGNLALSVGARGGVFLAGGILPRMVAALASSRFRACFEAKGRFAGYLAAIPTRLVVHPAPGLAGLARPSAASP